MSTDQKTQLNSKKAKKKWSKPPFMSLPSLLQWSTAPFAESLQTVIFDMQHLISTALKSKELDPLQDLALLFNTLKKYDCTRTYNEESGNQISLERNLCFINQAQTMGANQYIDSIILSKQVPLKPQSNHDLFNALMWMSLPQTRFNCAQAMYQASRVSHTQSKANRSSLEDRFTLFDESGIALFSDDLEMIKLIENRAWKDLFYKQAERCQTHLKLWIVGHGLYEQLLNPYVGLVAYGRCYHVDSKVFKYSSKKQRHLFDQIIAQDLERQLGQQTLELSAIPILGYPTWWPQQTSDFYNNSRYFRGPYPKHKP